MMNESRDAAARFASDEDEDERRAPFVRKVFGLERYRVRVNKTVKKNNSTSGYSAHIFITITFTSSNNYYYYLFSACLLICVFI